MFSDSLLVPGSVRSLLGHKDCDRLPDAGGAEKLLNRSRKVRRLEEPGPDVFPAKGGKPQALPGVPRLAGLTVPGIYECFALRTVQSSMRTTNPRAVIPAVPAVVLGRDQGRNPAPPPRPRTRFERE